jgi:hypothetical protein
MIKFNGDDLVRTMGYLEEDLITLSKMIDDPSFINSLKLLVASNFDRVWASEGSNINQDWNGRTLVKSGRLKLSLTTPGSLNLTIIGDQVLIQSSVNYARYVNDRYVFYGVDETFDQELTMLVQNYLSQRGKLKWR